MKGKRKAREGRARSDGQGRGRGKGTKKKATVKKTRCAPAPPSPQGRGGRPAGCGGRDLLGAGLQARGATWEWRGLRKGPGRRCLREPWKNALVRPGLKMSSTARLRRRQYGRSSVAKSSKPYKPFLPTSYSPQEGYLKEGEDMLSIKELRRNVADNSERHEENHKRPQSTQLGDASGRDTRKEGLFQHFYQVVQKERDRERPSDCVIVCINNEQRDYATGIGHRLQDHGLVVEMIHLSSTSSLTRALQEVKDDGSPFCILVEQSNVKLSSCTVIMLHESIKIHRHMPLEDALELVAKEYRRFFSKREQQECAGIALQAGDLVDDFLARERLTSYSVPSGIQRLLFLLSEGMYLYGNELNLLIDYLKTRKGQLEGFEALESLASSDHPSFQVRNTPVVGKPPPLLPTPGKPSFSGLHPPLPAKSPLLGDRPGVALLPPPGSGNPKGLFAPPLLPAAPSKRPPLGWPQPRHAKRPLLGEKQGLLAPPPVLPSVLPKQTVQRTSLLK
ncbi:nuclear receptor coactivator 5-like isoform X7 [Ailuropoda melanoleuca]|uniref:Nuclear receptor coactivator 5-like n=2 Tax=Ailuropoda melanoleuca TaxID=9646 RepID=A0A7N5JNC0_AILME|nr:nuclear receptor coactivator 5-like isoform X7 [Ailuropoda melanoleuca]